MVMRKVKSYVSGNTVYEIDQRTKKPRHIIHGVDSYFRSKHGDEESDWYEEEEEENSEPKVMTEERRQEILKIMGKKKKFTSKASGPKDIAIEDRRKRNKKAKTKRKMRKK